MSFQNATATALPAEVQLAKEKPQGAFCLRSRYALSANSANSWLAGSLVSLPLQTGTPATFTDVKQGNINCTLQISNTNPYVDYLNFGPCGAIIFFDEMRIYSSGTPIEENLRYSETVDLLMEQGGWQSTPYHVFRRNKWRANNGRAGDKHINFIKPAMVDAFGVPMFGRTPFMDRASSVYCPPTIAFGYQVSGASGTSDINLQIPSKYSSDSSVWGHGIPFGVDGLPFNDDSMSVTDANLTKENTYQAATFGKGPDGTPFHGRNSSSVQIGNGSRAYMSDHSGWKNTQVGRTATNGLAVNGTYAHLPAGQYVPSQWPDYQPCTLSGDLDDYELDLLSGKTKVAEYMKYLANVRSLPIGVPGQAYNNGSYIDNVPVLPPAAAVNVNSASCRFVEYRVSMPFVSGIYGILADKMFPDLLIGANNIRIEFKLAQNQKALWLTMDPCRRVPGTVRDFVPFTGETSGAGRAVTLSTTNGYALGSTANSALGCMHARLAAFDSTTALGYGVITRYTNAANTGVNATAVNTDYAIVRNSNCYSTASAMGEDLVPIVMAQTVAQGPGAANNVTYGAHLDNRSNLPKPQYIPMEAPWSRKSFFVLDGSGAPTATPTTAVHVNENAVCYGTYLGASTPQTRRCQPASRLRISDSFTSQGTTAFAIRDLQYIGEQVQLDDISASSIIQMAATSEIVVWSRGYRSFEANCSASEQQNIILPIQIGQATAMYLIFRPGAQIQNFDYYSNSFSCPFTGLSFNGNRTGVEGGTYLGMSAIVAAGGLSSTQAVDADVGGVYHINSSLDTQNQGSFSYQLFSGTRQYPLQPIQTVSELLVEREKSCHSLHNWAWSSTDNMQLFSWGKSFNSSTTTGLTFDPFEDLGYFTTFVPTMALDDQTITQNPYFSIAECKEDGSVSSAGRIRGIRQPTGITSAQSQFIGVLNKYVPPIGTFFLGWDFESWTNHDDLMRTGKFLGQEQLSVRMTGCYLMTAVNPQAAYTDPVAQPIQCSAIVPHIVKLSFVPGGHLLTYY